MTKHAALNSEEKGGNGHDLPSPSAHKTVLLDIFFHELFVKL